MIEELNEMCVYVHKYISLSVCVNCSQYWNIYLIFGVCGVLLVLYCFCNSCITSNADTKFDFPLYIYIFSYWDEIGVY